MNDVVLPVLPVSRSVSRVQRAARCLPWLALAIAAAWMAMIGTHRGIGTVGDSVTYFSAAETLRQTGSMQQASANGDLMPLIQFPPGYPAVLAAMAKLCGGVLAAARVLNIGAIGVIVFLIGWLSFRLTRSLALSIAAAMLFAFEGQVLGLHLRMLSEPLYLVLMLSIIAILLGHGARGRSLFAAGVLAAAAVLVRFAGVQLIACCAIWIVWTNWPRDQNGSWRVALRRCAAFIVPPLLAAIGWAIRNKLTAGVSDSRKWAYHPPNWGQISPIFDTLKPWVIPFTGWWQWPALVIVMALWAAVPAWMWWRYGPPRRGMWGRLALPLLVILTYVPFLLVARTFFDAAIPFNYRLLAPIHPLTLILATVLAVNVWRNCRDRLGPWQLPTLAAIAAVVLGTVGVQAHDCFVMARADGSKGIGYGTAEWRQSPTLALIRTLPDDAIIYSNAADAVYLLTGKLARPLPLSAGYATKRGREVVEHGLVRLYKDMSQRGAIVIYFTDKSVRRKKLLVSESQILARVHDPEKRVLADSRIYYFGASAPPPFHTQPPTTRKSKHRG